MPPSVRADGLRREFGAVTALDGVDLSVTEPEIVGLAGPNGAGKTTLIEVLLGLLAPTDGTVRVGDVDPRSFDAADRRRLGYMPQHEAVYRDLTVRENVDFFARLYGVDDRADAVADTLDHVGLAGRADARVSALSGGMVRRSSLACALVHDPDVLFLDEPTVGLDPELRATMWEGFRDRRTEGSLVFVSTHYLGEARHCDRILFLRNGRVLAFAPPATLRERTVTDDLEDAFLALLREADAANSGDGSRRDADVGAGDDEEDGSDTGGRAADTDAGDPGEVDR